MSDQFRSKMIELARVLRETEYYRSKYHLEVSKIILEDVKAGRLTDPEFIDLSGMKERYLEALFCYGFLGLTPFELFEKRRVWLWRPSDVLLKDAHVKVPSRVKTVAMFLNRLQHKGLAHREREGHTYRYFLTEGGRRRWKWYENRVKSQKKATDKQLENLFWKNFFIKARASGIPPERIPESTEGTTKRTDRSTEPSCSHQMQDVEP